MNQLPQSHQGRVTRHDKHPTRTAQDCSFLAHFSLRFLPCLLSTARARYRGREAVTALRSRFRSLSQSPSHRSAPLVTREQLILLETVLVAPFRVALNIV